MSWAAHELESYFIQKHIKARVSYLGILLGCLAPDFTKQPVYGFSLLGVHVPAETDPWKYHRGWPGVGFTHSLTFGVVLALIFLLITRSRAWSIGILVGTAAHVLTDMFDSVGTMLFFPFTTQHYTIGMWAYASQEGRYGDAAAYYSSLGGVWDFLWLCLALTGWRVFTARFFFTRVWPNDGVWTWLRRRFSLSDTALLAMYRAYFIYGGSRIFAWFIWARVVDHAALDWSWGGPYWVDKATTHYGTLDGLALRTLIGLGGLAASCAVAWLLFGRRLWRRAGEPRSRPRTSPIPREDYGDLAIYVCASLSLIGLGAWLRTPILNWIVGPGFVIVFVVVATRLRRSISRRPRSRAGALRQSERPGPAVTGRV